MDKDSEKIQSIADFIQTVKEEKPIYDFTDPDYKHLGNKALAWDRVALKSDMTVAEAKRRWKNLRDSYTKYLKAVRMQTATNSKKYQFWAHAQSMDFLKPFQGPSRSRKKECFDSIQIINANDYESISYGEENHPNYDNTQLYSSEKIHPNDDEMQTSFDHRNPSYNLDGRQYPDSPYDIPEYSDNEIQRDASEENVIKTNLLIPKINMQTSEYGFYNGTTENNAMPASRKVYLKAADLDSTSLFFLSLAKSVRKMPTKYQARIKVQCLQIVNEMELNLETSSKNHWRSKKKPSSSKLEQQSVANSEHFTYEMSPSNVEAMIEITSSDDENLVENGPN